MGKRQEQDELSKLLDAFEDDGTLERKMDQFEKKREKHKQIQKQKERRERFEKEYETPVDVTQVIAPVREEDFEQLRQQVTQQQSMEDSGQTRMWDREEIEEDPSSLSNKTVVIDDEEIQSLLKEEKGPLLHRKVVKNGHSKKGNSKIFFYVVLGISGLLLAGLMIFGIGSLISNSAQEKISEEEQKANYEEILSWAKGYDENSSSDKKKLIEYEKKYNQLTDEQKKEIDKVLKERTGSNFNTLLAKAKSSEKEEANNNNTEIAEEKAKLRNELSKLKKDLSQAKAELDQASSNYASAKSEYDSLSGQISSANQAIASAQEKMNSAENAYRTNLDRISELQNIPNEDLTEEQNQELIDRIGRSQSLLDAWSKAESEYDATTSKYDLNSLTSQQTQARSKMDQAASEKESAQAKVDDLNQQISEIQSKIDALDD